MALVDEIAIKLGIQKGQLKAALADAGADIKKFKQAGDSGPDEGLVGTIKRQTKGLNDLKNLLAGGAIAGAVKAFFTLAIDAANKSTDANDKNAAAVRDFAKGFEDVKGVAASVAVVALGTFNRIGSAIGDAINILRSFAQNGTKGFEVWKQNADAIAASGAAAEVAEKHLADVRKKNGAEFTAITKELEAIEKRSQDQKLKGLTIYETEKNIFKELGDLRARLAASDGDMIVKRRLVLEIAKTQLAADDATLAVKKDQADIQTKFAADKKKSAEDEKKAEDDQQKRRALSFKDEAELFALQNKSIDRLSAADKERLKQLIAQKVAQIDLVTIEDLLEKKITDGLTPAEKKQLAELLKQRAALEAQEAAKAALLAGTINQLPAEQAVTAEMKRQLAIETEKLARAERAKTITVGRTGSEAGSQSQAALEGLLTRLTSQVEAMQRDTSFQTVFSPNGRDPLLYAMQAELFAVQKELRERRAVTDVVNRLGEDAARRQFGDTLTDKALREVQDATTRTAILLSTIEQRLAASPFFAQK